jgi:5-formyltetrahydrofolate cyclo-ligase
MVLDSRASTDDPRAAKAELRAIALARRATLSEMERREASVEAAARLKPFIRSGETVSLFWPMRDEIDPRALIGEVLAVGGRVAMPVIEKRRMFFRLFDGEGSLEPGVFGTHHPHAGMPVTDPDFIVAPLAAFDRRGGRIGYGAGYYDAAITGLSSRGRPYRLAGIAFACQEVAEVPIEPHDVALPLVATERELIRTGAAA